MRRKIFAGAVLFAILLCGCSKKDEAGLALSYKVNDSVTLVPGEKFPSDVLTETVGYFEGASCYYEGLDKQFSYDGYEVTTYPGKDGDYIRDISVSGSALTDKGVGVGSTLSDIEKAYGTDYVLNGKMYSYYEDDKYLYFFIMNDVVKYYGYGIEMK